MTTIDRIEFGAEDRTAGSGVVEYVPVRSERCPECGIRRGQAHEPGCPIEQCPRCGEPLGHCGHQREILD